MSRSSGVVGSPTPSSTSAPPSSAPSPPPPTATATATATGATTSTPLAGATVVLDPGHNGGNAARPQRLAELVPAGGFRKACNTVGASTDAGYPEHAFAFDVARRAAALLRARGATVVLTRTDDTGFGPCVDARAAIARAARADAVVSVHADGGPRTGRGFHVITPGLAPDGGNAAVLDSSHELALAVRAAFRASTGQPYATYTGTDGIARRDDLAGLNLARAPTVLVECGNMRHPADAAALARATWRDAAAVGIVDGIEAFLRSR